LRDWLFRPVTRKKTQTKVCALLYSFFMKILQVFLFSFILSTVAFAQTTGSLHGSVLDPNNAVVPNAAVTISSQNGTGKTVTSNNSGEFTITGLPAGNYVVKVNVTGFVPYENASVVIEAGKRTDLPIILTIAVTETVTVPSDNGNKVTNDPENNADATVLKGKDIESLPEDPDELAAALQALAGASAGPNGGQFYIDGFSGGRLPPREAIREIRINQNPFSSEYDRPGFGRIEILTKPGADKFRGQGFYNFNNQALNTRNPFSVNKPKSSTNFFGGNLSGPIVKNKSSFFFDFDRRLIDNNTSINATVLDANLNPSVFAQALVVPIRRTSFSPRVDFAINDRNTLIARYSFQRSTTENGGLSEFTLPTVATNSSSTEHNIQLTETAVLSPTIVNETRFQFEHNRNEQNGNNAVPQINVAGSFVGGGSSIGLSYNVEKRYELQNNTTWSLGKHTLKFGARLRGNWITSRTDSNFAGAFTFAGNPTLSSLSQYRQRILGSNDLQSLPTQFTITAGNPVAKISQTDFSIFVNDDWRVNPRLTLSYGLRYEAQTNVKNNLNFAPRFGFAYQPGAGGARPPKTVFRGGFGIFYDRISDNLSLQSIRFNGTNQVQYIVRLNDPNPAYAAAAQAILRQAVFTNNGVSNVPTAAQISAVLPSTTTVRRLDPDIKSPMTMQGAISVERQLPFRTTASATYLWTRTRNLLRTRNINAPTCPSPVFCPPNSPVPFPGQGNIYQFESNGRFDQNQLIINFNTRLNPNFTLFGNYRLARAESDVEGGGGFGFGFGGAGAGGFPQYSYDLSSEYGNSTQDIRHFFILGGSIGVPFGIRLSPFITARSGVPFNITTGVDTNSDSLFTERPTFAQLGARCQALNLTRSFCNVSGYDPNATIPRNFGRGPNSFQVNLNATKTFGFGTSARERATRVAGGAGAEVQTGNSGAPPPNANSNNNRRNRGGGDGGIPGLGGGGRGGGFGGFGGFGGANTDKPYNLTFGVQISNLFNRTNLGQPIGVLSSPRFGLSNSIGGGFGGFGGGSFSNAGNRRIVLTVRFSF
jgi:hypothetical protein